MHKLEVFGLCFVSKTATFSDLTKFPFQASCSKEDPTLFAPVQRNKVCKASWCSTPDGVAIEGTLIYGNKQPDCSKINTSTTVVLSIMIKTVYSIQVVGKVVSMKVLTMWMEKFSKVLVESGAFFNFLGR